MQLECKAHKQYILQLHKLEHEAKEKIQCFKIYTNHYKLVM